MDERRDIDLPLPGTLNPAETIPPAEQSPESRICLERGRSVPGGYVAEGLLSDRGRQADVYQVKKDGAFYVLKLYRGGRRLQGRLQGILLNLRHPNVARILDCGELDGAYYEIYEYFPEGTLEQAGKILAETIRDVVIPCVNEGLHALHENGVIHCDVKPGNLFFADGGRRVVIGDCGLSGLTESDGRLVGGFYGTPEYAPRVRALPGSVVRSPAYDYGSLGFVLCRLALGRSLYEGMSLEEIARAREAGIRLPGQIDGRLAALIRGLLAEDEAERWGYEEVKRWCGGGHVSTVVRRRVRETEKKPVPLIFGRVDGSLLAVSDLRQLAEAIRENWEQARNVVRRRQTADFIAQFDPALADSARELVFERDADRAVFKLLVCLDRESPGFCYRGVVYPSVEQYVRRLDAGGDPDVVRVLMDGLLVYYLRQRGMAGAQVDTLEKIVQSGQPDMTVVYTVCNRLLARRTTVVFGREVDSLDGLVPVICGHSPEELVSLLRNERFIGWLNGLGYTEAVKRMREVRGA